LKLAPFPTRSPLPLVALPSISLFPSARFTDNSEISRQLVAILVSRANVTTLLPVWRMLSIRKVCPAGEHAKNIKKDAQSAHLPVPGYFWLTKHTNNTNDENDEARMTNDEGTVSSSVVLPWLRRYFLISRGFGYFVSPVLFASPSLRAKIGKPIPLTRPGSHPPSSRSR
jgi:hypothetical protein